MHNNFIGVSAGNNNSSGGDNNFIGDAAGLANTGGNGNNFIGTGAGESNTTGSYNDFFGGSAGAGNKDGTYNVFIGSYSGGYNTSGQYNNFMGYQAGSANTTGNYNTFIGYNSGIDLWEFPNGYSGPYTPNNLNNATAIGYFAQATASNTLILGGTGSYAVNVGIGTTSPPYTLSVYAATTTGAAAIFQDGAGHNCIITPSSGASVSCSSDARLKKNVQTLSSDDGLLKISELRPVTYNWLNEGLLSATHTGFIAQEVQSIFPDLVTSDPSGMLSLSYSGFVPYMVQAIQQLDVKINTLASSTSSLSSLGATSTSLISMASDWVGEKIIATIGVFGNLTVGSSAKPMGITLYDQVTGQPYCLKVVNGMTVTAAGECSQSNYSPGFTQQSSEVFQNPVGGTSTGTTTATSTATSTGNGSNGNGSSTATSTDPSNPATTTPPVIPTPPTTPDPSQATNSSDTASSTQQ